MEIDRERAALTKLAAFSFHLPCLVCLYMSKLATQSACVAAKNIAAGWESEYSPAD
jgi:hypothetical protein